MRRREVLAAGLGVLAAPVRGAARTIVLLPRWSDGQHHRLPELAAELVRLKVDVIVAAATPASQAVQAATSSIPIVIVAVAGPVRAIGSSSSSWRRVDAPRRCTETASSWTRAG